MRANNRKALTKSIRVRWFTLLLLKTTRQSCAKQLASMFKSGMAPLTVANAQAAWATTVGAQRPAQLVIRLPPHQTAAH
jgi:hypothetical protein